MPNRDLIAIGASAGGIEALQELVAGLPADLPAAVLVVLHMPPNGGRALERILSRPTKLKVAEAVDGEALRHGRIYTAVGDAHLLVGRGHVHLRTGPRENGYRPAVDPLFRSAAAYYGPRAVGVVLSGSLNDGTAGLFAIRNQGGLVVVQDPADALYGSMPASALEYVGADYTSTAAEMGPLLGRLATETVPATEGPDDEEMDMEVKLMVDAPPAPDVHPGKPSPWPCPDCAGVLWEIEDGPILRFRCRVGHAWDAETLLEQQGEGVEGAMWMALRALEDRAALSGRLAERAENGNRRLSASRYREDLAAMDHNIEILRRLLAGTRRLTGEPEDDDTEEGHPRG